MTKLYQPRDIEAQGHVFYKHVDAITKESLHETSRVAAELAHRDILIAELERKITELCN